MMMSRSEAAAECHEMALTIERIAWRIRCKAGHEPHDHDWRTKLAVLDAVHAALQIVEDGTKKRKRRS